MQHQHPVAWCCGVQLTQPHAGVEGHADGHLRLPVLAGPADLQHLQAACVDVALVAHRRQLHAGGRVGGRQVVLLPRPARGGLQAGQTVAHSGRRGLGSGLDLISDGGQCTDGPAHVGPGDGGQVLGRGLVALQVLLVAQVQRHGLVDQRVSLLDARRNGVEPGPFLPVVGVSLGLTPAARK